MNTHASPQAVPLAAEQEGLLRPLLTVFVALSVLTGLLYPAIVTGLAKGVFPHEAAGSLIVKDGKTIGSSLIGQPFSEPRYFWGRLSATAPMPYNAAASGGSNLGPSNPALTDAARARIEALRAADPGNTAPVPVDLVTASGSGLDPHISLAAAEYQAARVARARGLTLQQVRELIAANTDRPALAVLGDAGVNVLRLNLALDSLGEPGPK
ncbi:potassium-transporting ATPase subunit KdpC [Cupriavidus gilardii]|uniref:Potassium-transporting ATPase KdpC subunit n=1 Tax=Cupriavidus gilardii TaxID=82541 RepID=A0A849BIX9_9BURK|nr:potassium-transporting ATPase subunit KdpC [Cupriavidus gilardii]KAB0595175.1 potassium-transporting ATPase subunit KdpC [Cupriavidus gilardii]MCT9016674.1 potassium-transporting ATPase subunit KdpC [Cupriavidus gilardii]MCT9056351.1 potassium-transporting ATPase subunit KdpC [Cupriavidus gilardii]NNH13713.1 potassium-transporting ATPase subunit KdpC [Cupriavidus gilardii]WNG72012.1 potassium-transporting ATPase subunit KdpC [Cupriavidus gilardii]